LNFSTLPFLAPSAAAAAPTDYANLAGWWDADYLGYADATAIDNASAKFTDRSSNANHLIQATAANRPQLKTNIINGRSVIRFDGVASPNNDKLLLTSAISLNGSFTLIVIGKFTMVAGDLFAIWGNPAGNDKMSRIFTAGSVEQMGSTMGGGNATSSTLATVSSSVHMMTLKSNGVTVWYRENKTARGTTTHPGVFGITHMGQGINIGAIMKGDIAEAIAYTAHRSDAEVDNLYDNYLKAKWGLP